MAIHYGDLLHTESDDYIIYLYILYISIVIYTISFYIYVTQSAEWMKCNGKVWTDYHTVYHKKKVFFAKFWHLNIVIRVVQG